ncbi:MAG: hypothetical protein SGARI_004742, partial [Bacillariaceae sp.]
MMSGEAAEVAAEKQQKADEKVRKKAEKERKDAEKAKKKAERDRKREQNAAKKEKEEKMKTTLRDDRIHYPANYQCVQRHPTYIKYMGLLETKKDEYKAVVEKYGNKSDERTQWVEELMDHIRDNIGSPAEFNFQSSTWDELTNNAWHSKVTEQLRKPKKIQQQSHVVPSEEESLDYARMPRESNMPTAHQIQKKQKAAEKAAVKAKKELERAWKDAEKAAEEAKKKAELDEMSAKLGSHQIPYPGTTWRQHKNYKATIAIIESYQQQYRSADKDEKKRLSAECEAKIQREVGNPVEWNVASKQWLAMKERDWRQAVNSKIRAN